MTTAEQPGSARGLIPPPSHLLLLKDSIFAVFGPRKNWAESTEIINLSKALLIHQGP